MRSGPAALLVSALFCLLPSTAMGAGRWITPETVAATGTSAGTFYEGRTIGVDAAGGVDVAWIQSEGGGSAFYVARRSPRSAWSVQQIEPGSVADAAMAEAPGGTAILVYATGDDTIRVRWRPAGGAWSTVTALTGGFQIGSPRVDIADDGTATVAWRSAYNGDIYAVRGTVTGGFGTPELVTTDAVYANVAVSPAGDSLVSFRSGRYDVAVAERGASAVGFGTPTVLGTARTEQPGGAACTYRNIGAPAVTISASGRAVVAWADTCADYVRDVNAAVRTAGTWGTATRVGDMLTSYRDRVRVASDDAGDVVVGFELGSALRVAELAAGSATWSPEQLVFDATGMSVDGVPSLDMGPGGEAVFTDGLSAGGSSSRPAIARRAADGTWTARDETSRSCYSAPRAPQAIVDAAGDSVVTFGCYLNPSGGPTSLTEYAVAYVPPPTITGVSVPATGETGQALAMSATSSGPGAWGDAAGAALTWDFGDGSATATGASVSHAYATTGAKTVTLTADDGSGATTALTRSVTVSRAANQAPVAAFSVSPAGTALTGDTLTLDPAGSHDRDADGALVKYEWDLDGDGTYEQTETTPVVVTRSFDAPGAHTIGLRVTDDRAGEGNGTATTTKCVEVVSPSGAGPGDGVTPGCDGTVTGGAATTPATTTTPAATPTGTTTTPAADKPAADTPTPGCGRVVEIGPLQAFAVNCWERDGLTWKTTGRVRLNGIDLLPSGGAGNIVIDPLNLKVSSVGTYVVALSIPHLPPVTIYSGLIQWSFDLGRPSWLPLLPFEIDQKKQQAKDAKDSIKTSRGLRAAEATKVPGFTGCPDPNADPKAPKPPAPVVDPNASGVATQLNCFIPPKIELPGIVKLPTIAIPLSATADLVGMKLKGHAGLALVSGGAELSLSASVPKEWMFGLVGDTAGQTVLKATMSDGVQVESLGVDVGETNLFGIKLKDLHVGFDGAADRWEGALHVELPLPTKPLFGGQMAFEHQRLVALGIHTDGLNKPMFAGAFLQRIDVDIDTAKDIKLKGGVGITAGPVVLGKAAARVDGDVEMQLRDPFVLQAKGTLKLVDQQVADAAVKITSNGTFDFAGNVGWSWGSKNEFGVTAHVGGWIDANRSFDVSGNAKVALLGWNAQGELVVSSLGVGACAEASGIGKLGFGYKWGDNLPSLTGCDLKAFHAKRGRIAQAGGEQDVTVPGGQTMVAWAVHGRGDAPRVDVTGPGGARIASSADGSPVEQPGSLVLTDPDRDVTYVVVGTPKAGRWTIAPQAGSAPLATVETAAGLPRAAVRASVTGSGASRRLRWSLKRIPGQRVRLFERAEGVSRLLATTSAARGTARFTPAFGPAGSRDIVAVVEQDGRVRTQLVAGRYTAPVPRPPAAPRGLKVRRSGERVTVSWRKVAGARTYRVSAEVADGPRPTVAVTATRAVLGDVPADATVTARVVAVDANDVEGAPATARVTDERQVTTLRVVKGAVIVGVPCPVVNDGACRGVLRLALGRTAAGKAPFTAQPGATAPVKVRLSAKALKAVRRKPTSKLTATVSLAGGLALEPVTLTVRR